jgi:hypothetical protein
MPPASMRCPAPSWAAGPSASRRRKIGGFGGQHQDRRIAVARAQPPAQLQPLHPRQHEVEDDQIPAAGGRQLVSADAIGRQHDLAVEIAQVQRDEFGDIRIVLDDQNSARHGSTDLLMCGCFTYGSRAI